LQPVQSSTESYGAKNLYIEVNGQMAKNPKQLWLLRASERKWCDSGGLGVAGFIPFDDQN
jgi:hypothetical protein